jgi:hypothetical protein
MKLSYAEIEGIVTGTIGGGFRKRIGRQKKTGSGELPAVPVSDGVREQIPARSGFRKEGKE